MKTLIVLLITVILIIQASGYLIKVPSEPAESQILISQSQRINLQKRMIPLFENVCESSSDATVRRLAEEFTMEPEDYSQSQTVIKFLEIKSSGLLSKGIIFTEYDVNHMNELQIMYEILYSANNIDIFYKTAAWARQNLNCGLYVNAIYMALQNREDTQELYIPAPYELLPNYFIVKDVFKYAFSIYSNNVTLTENIRYVGNSYIIDANYTALFYNNEDDSKLAYFREDIGLNSYYYLRKLRLVPWLNKNITGNVGENMYQMMKQFMARYNLERYANGLPEISGITWNSTIDIPYDPMLVNSDGNEFGHRTLPLKLPESIVSLMIQSIEGDLDFLVNYLAKTRHYNKTQLLNHLIELLVTSARSYEAMAYKYFAKDQNSNGYPSVLDHYMTSFRDPIFWNINKKMVDIIDEALKVLPSYTNNELYFPGIKILNVDVKKLITAYDYFEFDASEALKIENKNSSFRIKIGQPRLNHKKFSIKINISSTVMQKGIMKIYLAPMFMPSELVNKKNLFVLLDVAEINLKNGSNVITRSSDNMNQFSEDFTSLNIIKNKIEDLEYGLDSMPLKSIQSQIGYPLRLILPKGTPQGLPLQMFIFVAPYFKTSGSFSEHNVELNTAALSPGYPFDLMITDSKLFELPNAIIKYVNVMQKSDSKVENYGGKGVTKSWYSSNSYDSSSRPNYNPENGEYEARNYYSFKTNNFNSNNGNNNIPEKGNSGDNSMNFDDLNNKSPILKSPNFKYTPNNMEHFDYKEKKAQFGNKGISYDIYKIKNKPDENIMPAESTAEYPLNSNNNFMNMGFDTNKEMNNNILENIETLNNNKINEKLLQMESLPTPVMVTKSMPGLYDYLSHISDMEYNTEKVYE